MANKGFCPICQQMILPGEITITVKPMHGRLKHYHCSCIEGERRVQNELPKTELLQTVHHNSKVVCEKNLPIV